MTLQPTCRRKKMGKQQKNDIQLNSVLLEEVTSYKYLGVTIDVDLNFKKHINGLIKNVAHKINTMYRIRKCVTIKALIAVYKAMVVPIFDIGDVFYSSSCGSYLDRLQVLQNRAIRIISRIPKRESVKAEHEKLNLLLLKDRRKLHLMQLAQWLVSQEEYRDRRMLSTRAHSEGRRLIKVINPNKELVRKSFIYRAAVGWNSLTTEIHQIKGNEKERPKFKTLVTTRIKAGLVMD